MKLAILSKEYGKNYIGGVGIHVNQLTAALAKIGQAFEVVVPPVGKLGFSNFQYADPRDIIADNNAMLQTLPDDIEIVHCQHWYSFLSGILAKKTYRVKLIATFHSIQKGRPFYQANYQRMVENYHRKGGQKPIIGMLDFPQWVEQLMCDLADEVIAVSEACKQNILQQHQIDPEKITIIPNGVNKKLFTQAQDASDLFKRYAIDPTRPTALVVNRFDKEKGIDDLLKLLPQLADDWQIVLCLPLSNNEAEIARFSQALNLTGKTIIWIKDKLPHENLPALYQLARVFISTAIYETFGMSICEAMVAGCPVVARATGGICETVADQKTGVLISPDASINEFASAINEFLQEAYYQRFHQTLLNFEAGPLDWLGVAKQTQKLYQRV